MENRMYVTGDTHGEEDRFLDNKYAYNRDLQKGDILFILGDFGYVSDDSYKERQFLKYLANEKPYTNCFIDGNHENFNILESIPVTEWNGGKVHVVRKDTQGNPKIIHLMRGQVYNIYGKKIFTMGGGYSVDKYRRKEGKDWFSREMPNEDETQEALINLKKNGYEVDYILTHTAPEETMQMLKIGDYSHEKKLNSFLEYIRENTKYKHWYFGHMHDDRNLWREQTLLYFDVRDISTNISV